MASGLDALIVEDVTLTRFVHGEAIQFVFVVVGDDDFAALRAHSGHDAWRYIFHPVYVSPVSSCRMAGPVGPRTDSHVC